MNPLFRVLALCSLFGLSLTNAQGLIIQDAVHSSSANAGQHRGPLSPDEELANLTRALHLSSDQQSRVKPILTERHDQLFQIRGDRTLSAEGKSEKMRALDDGANSRLEAVLNGEQRPRYEAMVQRRKERLQQQHAQHGAGSLH